MYGTIGWGITLICILINFTNHTKYQLLSDQKFTITLRCIKAMSHWQVKDEVFHESL